MKRKKLLVFSTAILISYLFFYYSNQRSGLNLTESFVWLGAGFLFSSIIFFFAAPFILLFHFIASWLNKKLKLGLPTHKLGGKVGKNFLLSNVLGYFLFFSWFGNSGALFNLLNEISSNQYPQKFIENPYFASHGRLVSDWSINVFYESGGNTPIPITFSEDNRWLYFKRGKDKFFKINLISKNTVPVNQDELPAVNKQPVRDINELNLQGTEAAQYAYYESYVVRTSLSQDAQFIELCSSKPGEKVCYTPVPFIKEGNKFTRLMEEEAWVYLLAVSSDESLMALSDAGRAFNPMNLYLLEVSKK